ncbi:phthiotriol/phenolphthiotriol dimycocerosates methyltransferase [Mycobacterium sp.]|uniref:phthiotriol/phenolphthiotriol dimycocerosates methyltransferase n=1 Tax=Mycobacterium sp. TaxID=1785 RepID=UPI002BD6F0B8|nr:class I SAM-dependent methyltransferase [Mycobacterium sp.]HTY30656.1 class I SAM-dependent methyltransferase [Mycobacterium sp.]
MNLIDRLASQPFVLQLGSKPLFKKVTQKLVYPIATRRLASDDVFFLNWGYEEDPPLALPLEASDEHNRYPIQLYHRTATQTDISGKRVLEVGCGHGGGASYLTRTLHPASYTGLDLNAAGIAFCRQKHHVPGLDFVQGDAQDLPFRDESFDVVINVESAHGYPYFRRFLSEVARVLCPGGHFLYTDLRCDWDNITEWEAALADAPLRMLSQREINAEVIRGIEKNSQWWEDIVDRHVPAFLQANAGGFAGVVGGGGYQSLHTGEITYRMYSFVKD